MDRWECEVCGIETAEDHDHSADAVVIRDGWRGQYLAPTEVLDIADLVGEDNVPQDVRDAADRWLTQMAASSSDGQEGEDDADTVLDWLTEQGESLLWDAGYSILSEDGYVIYRRSWDS